MDQPIGVFDSGIGGLTVVRALLRRLPQEDIVYFGDTARVPYGTKSRETIIRFSLQDVAFLQRFHVKLIVVACNTASSLALSTLQRRVATPIIGVIEPGAQAAVATTRNGRIGVIGTPSTIASQAYEHAIHRLDRAIHVYGQECPLLVPLAEEGWADDPVTEAIARRYLAPLARRRIDTLILGCTHYPLLKTVIAHVMGRGVRLVDSAVQTAEEVRRLLAVRHLAVNGRETSQCQFYVSDEPQRVMRLAKRFLGRPVPWVERVGDLPDSA
jgi:glutamate racemase